MTCFAQFIFMDDISGGPGRLVATFILGAIWAVFGVLSVKG